MTYRQAYAEFITKASVTSAITDCIGLFQPSTDDNNKIISDHIFRESALLMENAGEELDGEEKAFIDAVDSICEQMGINFIPDNDFQSIMLTKITKIKN